MTNEFQFKIVMVVDDTKTDRYIAQHVLKKNQFAEKVIEFDMAAKAIDYLEQNQVKPGLLPDIILLDIRMPDMDGFQFLERFSMLATPIQQFCCVIMLSSSLDDGDRERAENNPLVMKLFTKPLLLGKVEEIFTLCQSSDLRSRLRQLVRG